MRAIGFSGAVVVTTGFRTGFGFERFGVVACFTGVVA
jgi:hypothetical protein